MRPIPVTITAVTTIPAIIAPAAIASNAFPNLTLNTNATAEPDQNPVDGNSMTIKIVSSRSPYFFKTLGVVPTGP